MSCGVSTAPVDERPNYEEIDSTSNAMSPGHCFRIDA
jgi:hypothetical protein